MPAVTPELLERQAAQKAAIVESIRNGAYLKHAARAAGSTDGTVKVWRDRDEAFDDAVKAAQSHAVLSAIKVIQLAAHSDWKAAAWWLERAHPSDYSDKTELRVTHTGGVTLEAAMFSDPALTIEDAEEAPLELEDGERP